MIAYKIDRFFYWSGAVFLGIGLGISAIALAWWGLVSIDWEWPMLIIFPMGYIFLSVVYFIGSNIDNIEKFLE